MARLAIRMPKMSMTMTEGEVASWMVKVGDEIAEGDVVCEVMTDKVDMEVESTVSGTLIEIVVDSGMVDVGEPIGWVEGEDQGGGFGDLLSAPGPEPTSAPSPAPPETPVDTSSTAEGVPAAEAPTTVLPVEETTAPVAPQPTPSAASQPGPVAAVPRARALARERGIDLATLTGSGPDGLIRVGDVEQAAQTSATTQAPAAQAPAAQAPAAQTPAPAPVTRRTDATGQREEDRRAAVRRVVARVMTPTAVIPQFTVWREVHLDAADGLRQGLSWTTVLLRAYAASLREIPELLSRWEDDRPTTAGPPAVALAVATDRGLLVPTFTEPDAADAAALDAEIKAVVRAAQTGRLDSAYMAPANGSLSNLGGLGVDRFQALLTPPQASVLSLGSIRRRPVAVPGGVGVALTVEAGLTVDHRVADGAHAAGLLDRFARRLSGGL